MMGPLDDALLTDMEARAVEMARGAGVILSARFDTPLLVGYKDQRESDPVTDVDRICQDLVNRAIARHYPDHGIVGEEDPDQGDTSAPDLVWVVDPLDGTVNYVNGLPVYACSIGVLYRGVPIVGAIYFPWPGEESGLVMHARRGGGAFLEDRRIQVFGGPAPEVNRVATLPASFRDSFRFDRPMRGKMGDVRVTGSIAYELAMTAKGVFQYSVTGSPRLWDVAGGAAIVLEAGGAVMAGRREKGIRAFATSRIRWEPVESLIPSWQSGRTTIEELRQWSTPLVWGSREVVEYVTGHMRGRRSLRRRLVRPRKRGR